MNYGAHFSRIFQWPRVLKYIAPLIVTKPSISHSTSSLETSNRLVEHTSLQNVRKLPQLLTGGDLKVEYDDLLHNVDGEFLIFFYLWLLMLWCQFISHIAFPSVWGAEILLPSDLLKHLFTRDSLMKINLTHIIKNIFKKSNLNNSVKFENLMPTWV